LKGARLALISSCCGSGVALISDAGGTSMEHRGRFQVHGYNGILLDSETWDQDKPFAAATAHRSLSALRRRVSDDHPRDSDILERANAFAKEQVVNNFPNS
jgi:hypothetical protein